MSLDLPPGSGYVALGSSFGAGPGLPPRAEGSPRRAGRSSVNYAHLVAEAGALALTDVTYSGATTADFLTRNSSGVPAQVDAVGPTTRLVSLTGGGNDVGYLGALTLPQLPAVLRALPATRRMLALWTDATTMDARFESLRISLTTVVGAIRARSPQATIVIVDYLTIVPPNDALIHGKPDAATAARARQTAGRLSAIFRAVAELEGCEFLPVGEASRDHHAWAAEPWTRRFHLSRRGGAAYHPNAAGMRAVATMLEELLEIHPA